MKVLDNSYAGATLLFATGMPIVSTAVVQGDTFSVVGLENSMMSRDEGLPQLPRYKRIVEIPVCKEVAIEATWEKRTVYEADEMGILHPLMPAQPHRSKNDTTPFRLTMDSAAYSIDTFYGGPLAQLVPIGVARSRRLAALTVSPVKYNPATRRLMVYDGLQLSVSYKGVDETATEELLRHESAAFAQPAGTIGLRKKEPKGASAQAPLHYLIVASDEFRGVMDDFVAWKRKQGFLTTIAYTDEIGYTKAEIVSYIKSHYDNATAARPAPSFLLLVGDIELIPTHFTRLNSARIGSHATDLYYVTWTDGDILPDCYVGRFSANDVSELLPQLEKTMMYEKYAFGDPSYLGRAVLVAGADENRQSEIYADPQMDYNACRYFTEENGYHTLKYMKVNSSIVPPGVTVSASTQSSAATSQLQDYCNDGYGWINYSGHGLARGWVSPTFKTDKVYTMSNYGKPSVMIGNCCLTGDMTTQTCFAEALMRRGAGAGAVAYIGATNDTWWDDDFFWSVGLRASIYPAMHADGAHYDSEHLGMADQLFHIGGEPYEKWHTTMGAMIYAGNSSVMEADEELYSNCYWEIYTLFGDPSLMPWLGEASPMPLQYEPTLYRADGLLRIATEPYAYVSATSRDGETLFAAAFADGEGIAMLDLSFATDTLLRIGAIAQNRIPAFGSLRLIYDATVRIGISDFEVHGNNAGDTAYFSFKLLNYGNEPLTRINYMMRGDPLLMQPTHLAEYIHELDRGSTLWLNSVCPTRLSNSIADQSYIESRLQFFYDTLAFDFPVRFMVNAPQLNVQSYTVEGIAKGGEGVTLHAVLANQGHAAARSMLCSIRQPFGLAEVLTDTIYIAQLEKDSAVLVSFNLTLDSAFDAMRELPIELTVDLDGSTIRIPLSINRYDDDFESGDFTQLDWRNDERRPWEVSDVLARHGRHCARSYHGLGDRDSSALSLDFTSRSDDSIVFDYMVSSEQDNDNFYAILDGQRILAANGTGATWQHAAIPVGMGEHNILFLYKKDMSRADGEDCAWIDGLMLPPADGRTTTYIYLYDTVCTGAEYTFFDSTWTIESAGEEIIAHMANDTTTLLKLNAMEAPTVSIQCGDSTAFIGQTIYLSASGANIYRWNTGDSTASIAVRFGEPFTYSVVGSAAECSSEASLFIDTRPLAADKPSTPRYSVYPNPTSSILIVNAEGMRSLQLFDMQGRVLVSQNNCTACECLHLDMLQQGIYLLQIVFADGHPEMCTILKAIQ